MLFVWLLVFIRSVVTNPAIERTQAMGRAFPPLTTVCDQTRSHYIIHIAMIYSFLYSFVPINVISSSVVPFVSKGRIHAIGNVLQTTARRGS
jgi:hypothetical protein